MKVHFMGIGGSGMSGVAMLASKMGYSVTGCDLEGSTAYQKKVSKGHSKDHLKDIDLLVVSPAVIYQNKKHLEYSTAKTRKMVMTWQEFLGKYLMKDKKVIAVTGTHGKSTTTAMVGKMLVDVEFDPSVVVGARVEEWSGNARYGKSDWFVVEADEFFDNFLHYSPDVIILNNIEFDHPDYFKDEDQVLESYKKFISNLKKGGKIIANKTPLNIKPIKTNRTFNLKVMGEHNQQNARMVFALGKYLNIPEKKIVNSIENFEGIGRRMQLLGRSKTGFIIYDDYAHHPTAIKTTLEGLRAEYKQSLASYTGKKIWAIIEAHGYSRTSKLLEQYKGVFDGVDGVIVGPIFKARDKSTFGMTPKSIVSVSAHNNIFAVDDFKKIADLVRSKVGSDDIVIVMGAGKSYTWAKELLKI